MNKNSIYQRIRKIGIAALAGYGAFTAFRDVKDFTRKPDEYSLVLSNRGNQQELVVLDEDNKMVLYNNGENRNVVITSPRLEKMLGNVTIEVLRRAPLEELGEILARHEYGQSTSN